MASSIAAGPKVFISFRGADVRDNFMTSLAPALRKADINIFIDEDERLGRDLVYLLQRIEESEIALVIFSANYSNSAWCLDEIAKMKELKDQGRLIVIPIFYKIQPHVVSQLRAAFGDNFRDLKLSHQHEPERTRKWEEALTYIPTIVGMPLKEQSDKTDEEFIDSMVIRIKRVLEDMPERGNQAGGGSRQGGSMVPARQQENRDADSQLVLARDLDITHAEDSNKWAWNTIYEPPNNTAVELATMIKIYWLKIVGTYTTENLSPGTKYEAVFLVKLEDDAYGWEKPVTLKLKIEQHNGSDNRVDRTANLKKNIGRNWVDILAGVFVAPPKNQPAKITFTMFQYITDDRKKGLVVKGVAIRPIN